MAEPNTAKARMLAGLPYFANDPELTAERRLAKRLCQRYNQGVDPLHLEVLEELFGHPVDVHLEPPFYCDYGYNVRLGRGVYANHNLVILDCAEVTVGDGVFFGPNVCLSTAGHPLDPDERATGVEFAHPITIGARVWIGAGVTVLAGVTIGEGSTIGAGSVVTRSLPERCVAMGNPCRKRGPAPARPEPVVRPPLSRSP